VHACTAAAQVPLITVCRLLLKVSLAWQCTICCCCCQYCACSNSYSNQQSQPCKQQTKMRHGLHSISEFARQAGQPVLLSCSQKLLLCILFGKPCQDGSCLLKVVGPRVHIRRMAHICTTGWAISVTKAHHMASSERPVMAVQRASGWHPAPNQTYRDPRG
jgi:hypothetical protein